MKYGKKWAKILAWLLCALCFAGAVTAGSAAVLYYSMETNDFTSFDPVSRELFDTAYNAVSLSREGMDLYSLNRPNLGIQISEQTSGSSMTYITADLPLYDRADYTVWFDYVTDREGHFTDLNRAEDGVSDVYTGGYEFGPGADYVCGKVRLTLSTPQTRSDLLYDEYAFYKEIRALSGGSVPAAAACALIFVCFCVWILKAAGYTEADGGIHMIWLDHIPAEILAVLFIAAGGIIAVCEEEFLSWYHYLPSYSVKLMAAALISGITACLLMTLCWLCSMVRRVRTRSLSRTSLTGWLVYGLTYLVRLVPFVPKAFVLAAVLFVMNLFAVFVSPPDLLSVIAVAIDFAALAMIPFTAYLACRLKDRTALLVSGDLSAEAPEEIRFAPPIYHEINGDLDQISLGIEAAVEKQMKAERLRTELITNVSHDIRTPLTSIISYTDLLEKEEDPQKQKEYLDALRRNGVRMKKLTEDLLEASKASTGNIQAECEPTGVAEIIDQALGEYEEKLSRARLEPVVTVRRDHLCAMADGRLLWRVLSNLLSNCVKYAMPDTRVYIDAYKGEDEKVHIVVKNISKAYLNISPDELMERFVRGDSSRSSEGSGLGLNIAQSLCKIMNGDFSLTIDGDLFKAEIILDEAQ